MSVYDPIRDKLGRKPETPPGGLFFCHEALWLSNRIANYPPSKWYRRSLRYPKNGLQEEVPLCAFGANR
jgi:hypothetical protein